LPGRPRANDDHVEGLHTYEAQYKEIRLMASVMNL
jgi:hypothetical protein